MLVAQHLNFDVARIDNELFDENAVVAERRFRLGLRQVEAFLDFGFRMGDAHALAAAAGRRLDHDRITDLVGDLGCMHAVFDHAEITRHGGNLGLGRSLLRFDLVAHRGDRARIGTDENHPSRREGARESLTFGQEAVAWVYRLRAGLEASLDDFLHDEVAVDSLRRTDEDGLVGHLDMERIAVGFRIDGDRLDAHTARGFHDPAGDFAAIGDQYLLEHELIWTLRAEFGRDSFQPQFCMHGGL